MSSPSSKPASSSSSTDTPFSSLASTILYNPPTRSTAESNLTTKELTNFRLDYPHPTVEFAQQDDIGDFLDLNEDDDDQEDYYLYLEEEDGEEDDFDLDYLPIDDERLLQGVKNFTNVVAHHMGAPGYLGDYDDDGGDYSDDDDDDHKFDPYEEFAPDDPIWKYVGDDAWAKLRNTELEEAEYQALLAEMEKQIAELSGDETDKE